MAHTNLPLDDLLVVDLTIARAGPTAVRQLADWGARTIRIERPGPSDGVAATHRLGSDFQNLHRNKESLTLDLKAEAGLEVFFSLVRRADVLVENFRAPVKKRLGIDYESVHAVNPRLVYASISGFGQTGPYASRPGVDQIAQGLGGLMSVTGLPGQGPVRVGTAISDLAAGMHLACGILTALHQRQRTGKGRWVHTSLLEALIAMLDFQAARVLVEGDEPAQAGNHHPTLAPMGTFPTRDGLMNIAASSGRMFGDLCSILELQELVDDPRYATPGARSQNRDALNEAIAARTRLQPTSHWVDVLNRAGIPCGPIQSIPEALADPQVRHLGIARPVEHPELGGIELVGQAVHLEDVPFEIRTPAPSLGADSVKVLQELGYDDDHIRTLLDTGAVSTPQGAT